MALLRFELLRLARRWPLWAVWAAVAAMAVLEIVNLPDRLPAAVRLWPLPVAYLAAWGLAADLGRGGLDLLVSRGVHPVRLLVARVVLVYAAGMIPLAPLLAVPLAADPSQGPLALDLAVVTLYWAALGAALGWFASAGAVAALAAAAALVEAWWVTLGSAWLLGAPAAQGLAAPVTVALHLVSPLPAREVAFASAVFPWESLRLPVAVLALLAVARVLHRRSLVVSEG
ncbi:MAG: hypothetical protein D6739_00240 [Nitrospirae bacterium]|nr:MAG: hypothetical protein D6739_00240 [Nitrospirota bacterium]